MKSLLNPYILSNTSYCWCGYLDIYDILNSWISLSDDLPIHYLLLAVTLLRLKHGTWTISSQSISGSIITMHAILAFFSTIVSPVIGCLFYFKCGPIRSIFIDIQVSISATILGGRFP